MSSHLNFGGGLLLLVSGGKNLSNTEGLIPVVLSNLGGSVLVAVKVSDGHRHEAWLLELAAHLLHGLLVELIELRLVENGGTIVLEAVLEGLLELSADLAED